MKFKSIIALFSILATGAMASVRPGLAPAANLFHCSGPGNVTVRYSASSFAGNPHLYVEEGNIKLNLQQPNELKMVQTPMGLLVTGTYIRLALADGPTIHYNLVVPMTAISNHDSLKVETLLIKTTVASPFMRPDVTTQLQRSEAIPLVCDAKLVQF